MNYDELVKKHMEKLVSKYSRNSWQSDNPHMENELTTRIKNQILIHCLVKVEGSTEKAQKVLEKITLKAVEEIIDHPTHINKAEHIFNKFKEMIKKLG